MRADYHLHCEFSDDSRELMENQIEQAIRLGLDEICFTDHVDYGIKRDWDDPRGIEYRTGDGVSSVAGLPASGGSHTPRSTVMPAADSTLDPVANVNYPEYFAKLHRMQNVYAGRISIKAGLEFGIQTGTIPAYEKLFARCQDQLDFVLLSMHQVDNQEFWNGSYFRGKSQKEYNDAYYDEIYKVQQRFRHYSVLAHLDLLARYDPAGPYPFEREKDRIAAILELAIRQDKGIEINTSSWHYGLHDTQPSRNILKLYHDLGGRILTMGSDAHRVEYVGDHFDDARQILKEEIGFREFCTFEHMVPVFHPL